MLRSLLVTTFYQLTRLRHDCPDDLAAKWLALTSLRRFLVDHRVNLVFDVGANEGHFVTKLRRLGFHGPIVSFEPDPRTYAHLVAHHGSDPHWRGYPVALGDTDTEATLNLAANPLLSSFLTPVDHTNVADHVQVPVRRLDGLVSEIVAGMHEPRVLLKTDTQGFDLHVLRGASGCRDYLVVVFAELSVVPIYRDATPLDEALAVYRCAGFDLVDFSIVTRTVDGRILELDGLFVSHNSRMHPR